MRNHLTNVLVVAVFGLGTLYASSALATTVSGSDTILLSAASSNETGGNLGTSTSITLNTDTLEFSPLTVGNGSFSVVLSPTDVTLTNGTTLDLTSAASFAFNDPAVGQFTPTSILLFDNSATSLDIFIQGTFAPGTLFAGATAPLGASETFALTQTGGAAGQISFSGTFASPPAQSPVPVPEPVTLALFGAGLAGVGALRRRRKIS
jgi:hypothetical protein